MYVARIIGELENWRAALDSAKAFCVRKTGWKLKREVIAEDGRKVLVVVRVRRGVEEITGRWTSVRRARRAMGEIN